jgi:hypothetical protein
MTRSRSLVGALAVASLLWAAALPCACPEMFASGAGREHCGAATPSGPIWKASEPCACTCLNGGESARMPLRSGAYAPVTKAAIAPAGPPVFARAATVTFVAASPSSVSPPTSPPLVLRV